MESKHHSTGNFPTGSVQQIFIWARQKFPKRSQNIFLPLISWNLNSIPVTTVFTSPSEEKLFESLKQSANMKSGALHETRLSWVSEIISKNIHSDHHDFSMSSKMLMRIEHDANDVEWMEYRMGVHDETSCWGIMEFYSSIKYRLLLFRASSLHISFECILWAFLSTKVLENDVNEWKSSTDFGYIHTKYIFPTEQKLFRLRTEHEETPQKNPFKARP